MATRTAVQKRPQDEAKPEKSKPAAAERPKAATVDSHAKAAALMQDPHAVRDTPENVLEVAIGYFHMYHMRDLVTVEGDRVRLNDIKLLMYYRNRLTGYGLERTFERESAPQLAVR